MTNNEGVNVVYDGVGKDTFDISLKCLKFRGLMVSFGQSSGMVNDVNLHSTFNPKSLYYTRPTLMHYIRNSEELTECSNKLFSKICFNDFSISLILMCLFVNSFKLVVGHFLI